MPTDRVTTVSIDGFGDVRLTSAQVDEFWRFGSDAWVWKNSMSPRTKSAFLKNRWAYIGGGAADCLYLTRLGEAIQAALGAR